MSSAHDQPAAADVPSPRAGDASVLAHELSNLLDGSLRNVGLALSTLRDATPDATDAAADPDEAKAVQRLDAARQAMQQMAQLIRHWMTSSHRPAQLFHRTWTLREMVEHAAGLCGAAARTAGVTVDAAIDGAAGGLPAGPLHAVLVNALRNAIEAMARHPGQRHVLVEVRRAGDDVVLRVRDTGPGFARELLDERGGVRLGVTSKPQGHGIGLPLCREIAQSLGGSLQLGNNDTGGALFELRCPAVGLREDETHHG